MAITAATLRSDFSGFLTPEMSAPIFERARRFSVVQGLVRQVPLGAEGKSIPVVTGKPTANWVAEGAKKPASQGSRTLKTMTPKKLAAIVVNSMEVVRANPGGYVTDLREDLAEAFGIAFDRAALHNVGGDGTGTGPFTTWIDQTTKTNELGANSQANGGIHKDFVDSAAEVALDTDANGRHYKVTGWALDDTVEWRMWGAVDSTGRPLYIDLPTDDVSASIARPGRLLNRPSFMGEGVTNAAGTIAGYVGEWTQAAWGVVGGISYSASDQATVTINGELVSLWENNLVAIRAEAEYGWLVNDADAFCVLRNDTGS